VGRSPAMQAAFRALGRLARVSCPVLFTGPDGSGRAHAARVLVSESGLAGPVIEAGPDRMRRDGPDLLKAAAGGALILRRAEAWSPEVQDWVLEALETPRGDCPRILVTARADIAESVSPVLLGHLAVGRVDLPPVRERGEDRAVLFAHFLDIESARREISPEAAHFINTQVWEGEVLELRRVAQRLSLQGARGPIEVHELQNVMSEFTESDPDTDLQRAAERFFGACQALGRQEIAALAQLALDRGLIETALNANGGVRQDAAKALGLNRNTLTRRLAALDDQTTAP